MRLSERLEQAEQFNVRLKRYLEVAKEIGKRAADMGWKKPSKKKQKKRFSKKQKVKQIVETGKKTGVCGFCHRKLTDEKSITRGYGPTCAANNGLPLEVKV